VNRGNVGYWCLSVILVIFLVSGSIGSAYRQEPLKGFVMVLRGGIGAMAVIDTYYAGGCFEEVPVQYIITIEGDGVLFPGTRSGSVPGMSRTFIHTGFAFGFGSVTIKCVVTNQGKILEERTKQGIMIGFFVLA